MTIRDTTPRDPTTRDIVRELGAQHAHLRRLLDHCDAVLAAVEQGQIDAMALLHQVRALRAALTDHQAFEEGHLVLLGGGDQHRDHHDELALRLDDPAVRELANVLRDLRAHVAHEDEILAALADDD